MDDQSPETRLKALEINDRRQDERLDQHGRELDDLARTVAEIRVSDKHRDESMHRMEAKLDAQGGKMDALRQDILSGTVGKSAEKWEKAAWLVIAAIIGYALVRMGLAG